MSEHAPANAAMARLQAFIGVWDTEGEIAGASPFRAVDTYEWLPGGHFLLHRFNADLPDGNVEGVELIGYDAALDAYPMHAFDSTGNAGVMHARSDGERWTFTGAESRFTGSFREAGTLLVGEWELRSGSDATWAHWMTVRLRKRAARADEPTNDADLALMSREQLLAEVRGLRAGVRKHRDSSGHELCWHHPELWNLLPERSDRLPAVPAWPEFLRGCVRYRESLDVQLPHAPRSTDTYEPE